MDNKDTACKEFHISREARDRYKFDKSLFSLSGNVVFADLHSLRLFAHRMNERRDLISFPENAVKVGGLYAMGLIDEILHYVTSLYRQDRNPKVFHNALEWLYKEIGRDAVDKALRKFIDDFPPITVYRGEISPDEYLKGETGGLPNRQTLLEEMLMLWLENVNPALSPFLELFDDSLMKKETAYEQVISSLHDFFSTQPLFGPDNQNLVAMLRSPIVAFPHSLAGQLQYIFERWGGLLGKYLYRLLRGLDLIKEEDLVRFLGPGPSLVYEFSGLELEAEAFSPDRDWMPQVVLLAKNTYVWLDQLSKRYQKSITRLDEIPDEELDRLSCWGFTGLWLIGLWERSPASQRIKQLCGNPEAVASAYSIYDYQIAGDLGGEEAFQNLKGRAWRRGIRIASDMVPNHMGIYSKWVIEHPDWFISIDYSPFPSYEFTGEDLSNDERVAIYLENKYYTRSDAAVVFKRVDRSTGSSRYIYHGNDGTHMPWNDTAQLNYLNPDVREAVIQSILHVARKFPIIRFDAAMTLTKRHYQRLWFPEPGAGGAIPSRSEHGMTKKEFDALIHKEFWREVVDRVAEEAPDTLLLAEAFWLMEGYFVRTLGMHRVYNSAFMNMLKNEENASYRSVIKNTLEFDPEIMKRFVNFMSNPDEETAIAQFGKEDKYFGVCTMMATMPGLPMFGHGQIEGFREKYGMEYRRAYWNEAVDADLVRWHEHEIFPLLRKRYLFADVKNFLLYDLYTPEGGVNEDVFAYSNASGDEKVLVIYHNRYADVRGWLKTSAAYSVKTEGGGQRLVQKRLGEGLNLHNEEGFFCIFKDNSTGLEYIRRSKDLFEKGLYIELGAYKYHVFLGFHEARDNEWQQYASLTDHLNGWGVPSIKEALQEVFLKPVHESFKGLVNAEVFQHLIAMRDKGGEFDRQFIDDIKERVIRLLGNVKQFVRGSGDVEVLAEEINRKLEICLKMPSLKGWISMSDSKKYRGVVNYLKEGLKARTGESAFLLGWLFVHTLGKILRETGFEQQSRSLIDEWLLDKIVADCLREIGCEESSILRRVILLKILTTHQHWFEIGIDTDKRRYWILESWFKDEDVQRFLLVNRYKGILWFNKESFEELLWWMFVIAVVDICIDLDITDIEKGDKVLGCYEVIQSLKKAEVKSGYQVERLLTIVNA